MNQDFLESLVVNSTFEDNGLVKQCAIKEGTNGEYITGVLGFENKLELMFKVWSSSEAYQIMKDTSCAGKVCKIKGQIKEYNGKYIDIKTCEILEDDIEPYLEVRYDIENFEKSFWKIIESNVSDKGIAILKKILCEDNPLIYERFTKEFAAKRFHDNCLNGLFAHTCKCLTFLQFYIKLYPLLYMYKEDEEEQQNQKDLLFIGMALHDIGKIDEMNYGIYTRRSVITHKILGLELIFPYKTLIVDTYGEEWYDFLLSIIVQHHGGAYGDDAKSLPAMIVHLIDELDSTSTYLIGQLKDSIKKNECGETIYYDKGDVVKHINPYFNV